MSERLQRPATGPGSGLVRRQVAFLAAGAIGTVATGLWVTTQVAREDRIVFAAERQGAWDLWWVRGDGTGPAQLTATPLDERAPALSPDRSRVAYSTSDGSLWILNTSDRRTARLPLAEGRHSNPSWSADGRQLIFTTYTMSAEGEDATLWLYDLERRSPKQILLQDGAQDYGRIHPDGRSVVYSSSGAITVFGFGYSVVQQLWIMSLITGRVEQLLLARGKDTEPAWSPNGRSLVFVSDRDGATALWRIDSSGGALKQITRGPGASTHPAWSPGGTEIVFVVGDGRTSGLATVGAEGEEVQRLEIFAANATNVRDPHWR